MDYTFQLASDIHLELYTSDSVNLTDILAPSANNLILAGDIGDPFSDIYLDFIRQCSREFKWTFVICGNHEYYSVQGRSMTSVNKQFADLNNAFENVYFMERDAVHFDKLLIIGTILWSNIPKEYSILIESKINDYRNIVKDSDDILNDGTEKMGFKDYNDRPSEKDTITYRDTNKLYIRNIEYIKKQLNYARDNEMKVLIITHHAPSLEMQGMFKHSPIRFAYSTDLENMFREYPEISVWVNGHTHVCMEYSIGNTRLFSNCRGYPDDGDNNGYRRDFIFTI